MKLPQPGDVFAGYRLESELGEGGFATVFAARGADGVAVALKILKPNDDVYTPMKIARFQREFAAVSRLRSPYTVQLLGHGQSSGGLMFLVFELVGGRDLTELMVGRPYRAEIVRHILEQLLKGLADAHGQGLVHRDIKPANIRVFEHAGDPYRVKLLDFGIARSLGDEGPALTATGKVIGTVRFMAPEQLFGGDVLPTADLFSVGLVAFELLTGRDSDHLRQISAGRGVLLTRADTDDANLRTVVNRLLMATPSDRYATAAAALAALAGVDDAPIPRTPSGKTTAPVSRRAPLVGVWIAAAGVLGLGVIATLSIRNGEPKSAPMPVRAAPTRAVLKAERGTPEVVAPREETSPTPAPNTCNRPAPFVGLGDIEVLAGLQRQSLLTYIPRSEPPAAGYPVFVMLHDYGDTARSELVDGLPGLMELADTKGFVIVGPDDGRIAPWGDPNDVDKVIGALEIVRETLCIDESRIYAYGLDAGGVVVEQLPCQTGVAAIATSAYRDRPYAVECDTPLPRPVPYLTLSPLHDKYNPVKGGKACSGTNKIPLAEKEKIWRAKLQCSERRTVVSKTEVALCVTWEDCAAPYVSCHLQGGHNWPGVQRKFMDGLQKCDGEPANFPYAETIWHFFETGGEILQ